MNKSTITYAQEDLDQAYSDGGQAAFRGIDPVDWNPYDPETQTGLYRQWRTGYDDFVSTELKKNEQGQTPAGNT